MDTIRQCLQCAATLDGRRRLFCSLDCDSRWRYDRHLEASGKPPRIVPTGNCLQCGCDIPPPTHKRPGGTPRQFCSHKCSARSGYERRRNPASGTCKVCGTTTDLRSAILCRTCDNARKTALHRLKVPYVDTSPRVCAYEYCNESFKPAQQANAKYCSNECKQHAYMRRNGWTGPKPKQERQPKPTEIRSLIYPKTCPCGRPFIAHGKGHTRKYCSDRCSEQRSSDKIMGLYRAAIAVRNLTSAKHWHRTLCRYLADRDGPNCGICGNHVDIDKPSGTRGANGEHGPSVDHIIPTSKGGGDELHNLRLTHFGCNRKRGNRGVPEQLKLAA